LNTKPSGGDEIYLTRAARTHLREKFLLAETAITGVNFAIAETGEFVICTNEGNADMGVHLANTHIASMGIEKIIPRLSDLGVFTRLLARSATGQPVTTYTAHFKKPRKGQQMHIILVDNGRTKQLSRPDFRSSLHCIRCGACMNTCPIYRSSGGHSYGSVIPGPIGSILSPGFDLQKHSSLPFASTLCGSCSDVCPVKIDIHQQLYKWRQIISEHQAQGLKASAMKGSGWLFGHPTVYKFSATLLRETLKISPRWIKYAKLNKWGLQRELPETPVESFTEWHHKNRKKNE
jgi:L-lactate dehydrogenase complex protein LldF